MSAPPKRNKAGWYTLPDGQKCLSVTNVIKFGVPKDLTEWAAWEVANAAVEAVPKLSRMRGSSARWEMIRYLQETPNRKRDAAGDFGTAIHDIAEAYVLGKSMGNPEPDQTPFVQAFENFLEDHQPVYHAAELVVAHPEHGWAGRCDAWCELPRLPEFSGGISVIDYKTGKNAYPDACLQLSCYQRATRCWLDDGTEGSPPAAVNAFVLHIRPDKHPDRGYALIPCDTSDEVYGYFRAAQQVAEWNMSRSKSALGDAVELEAA
jgi:hypothetical protein